jgi:ABC-type amino acid transport substrate-binding protein
VLRMHRFRVASGILAAAILLTGCRQFGTGNSPSMVGLTNVNSTHTLRAAYIDYPPSMILNPNTKAISGIMPAVMTQMARAMGINVTYVEETTFASMADELNSGRVDIVVSGIWPSSARGLQADFSRVVYYSPVYAYVRNNDSRFDNNLAAINKNTVRIATIDGEMSSIVAQSDYPTAANVSLTQQADVSQLLLQLTAQKADVTFVEPAVADAFLAKNPGTVRQVAGVGPVRMFPNCFLFRKGDTGLRDAINIAIIDLTNSNDLPAIVKPYDPDGKHFILPVLPVTP